MKMGTYESLRGSALVHRTGSVLAGVAMASADEAPPPPATELRLASAEPALLPSASVRHIMKRTMGGEQDAVTAASVTAVQRCTTEFLNLVVSEARARVAKDRRSTVTYADMIAALATLGFKQLQEPLKAHMTLHYGEAAIKRAAKRVRTAADAEGSGDASAAQQQPMGPGCVKCSYSPLGCASCYPATLSMLPKVAPLPVPVAAPTMAPPAAGHAAAVGEASLPAAATAPASAASAASAPAAPPPPDVPASES